jgi:hypothetical protein
LGVEPTPWTACTAQQHDGSFCDLDSLPDAPFPICVKHASQLYGFLQLTVHDKFEALDVDITTVQAKLELNGVAMADRRPVHVDKHCVYYLRVGDLIKIGTTTHLRSRLQSYPPGITTVLAAEPGGVEVERARLAQFSHLRQSGREWFNPASSLTEHIAGIRAKHGEPFKFTAWPFDPVEVEAA